MAMADDHPFDELASREPTVEDLRELCRELNLRSARYVVIGGFALRACSPPLRHCPTTPPGNSSRANF